MLNSLLCESWRQAQRSFVLWQTEFLCFLGMMVEQFISAAFWMFPLDFVWYRIDIELFPFSFCCCTFALFLYGFFCQVKSFLFVYLRHEQIAGWGKMLCTCLFAVVVWIFCPLFFFLFVNAASPFSLDMFALKTAKNCQEQRWKVFLSSSRADHKKVGLSVTHSSSSSLCLSYTANRSYVHRKREMSPESLCATPSSPFEENGNSQLRVAIQRKGKRKTIFSF